jgi:3-hydroxyacyl-[acyl-carrier-protein] dehydratase
VLLNLMVSDKFRQMHFAVRRTIGADHPSLPGHFPGTPIVPGVVILDEVLAALMKWHEGSHVTVISAVKFLAPLKPDQPFVISLDSSGNAEGQIAFRCQVEGRLQIDYGSD